MSIPPSAGRVKTAIDISLIACAIILTGVTVGRLSEPKSGQVIRVTDHNVLAGIPRSLGATAPKRSVVVFTDYECPACRKFEVELDSLLMIHGDSVRIVIRHFPMEAAHPHALRGAVFAECASSRGYFPLMHAFLLRDDIGADSAWESLARATVVAGDTALFDACVAAPATVGRIRIDIALGRKIGVKGTPSVIVGQRLHPGGMPREKLERLLFH
jgi:protein-disulfide isomerase